MPVFRRSACLVGMLTWLFLAAAVPAHGQNAWRSMSLFKKIDVDPNSSFPLGEDQGPWMIMCVTFAGVEADDQARELVHELRSVYKLPAYTHRMSFDFKEGATGRGVDRFGAPRKMHYQRDTINEIAVLVGDYAAIDDPQAKKALEKIKFMQPVCLTQGGKKTTQTLAGFRHVLKSILPEEESSRKGPMGHAFITGNPLLPKEYFVPKGIDKVVYEMNKPLPNSLLNCTGKYTVKVATFNGRVVIDPKTIREIEQGQKTMSADLQKAGENAHNMCEALRQKGYEAYEFHDRHTSIVTVGSFDSIGTPRADGKIEINPAAHDIIERFSGKQRQTGKGPIREKPQEIAGLTLDLQAILVEVPKASAIVNFDRGAVSKK